MIILDVEKYCHECPEFEADVRGETLTDGYGMVVVVDHTIRCKHRDKCRAIKNHLEKENKNA